MSAVRVQSNRLQEQLALRGWNAVDLARASGVSPATLTNVFRGRRIRAATIRKIAIALTNAPTVQGIEDLLSSDG